MKDSMSLEDVIRNLAENFVLSYLLELLVAEHTALQETDLLLSDGRSSDNLPELFQGIISLQAEDAWLAAQLLPARDEKATSGSIGLDLLRPLQEHAVRVESQDTQPFRQLPQHGVHDKPLCYPFRLPIALSPPHP